ncbi:MAG: XkdX family protein [Oscillospiraceae bacterium]|nr:XkdX family protein [Oscillospiraceae bacterium]
MIFERIKALYEAGKIKDLKNYVAKGLITPAQAEEIMTK